jgi:hypothetical protein
VKSSMLIDDSFSRMSLDASGVSISSWDFML